MKGVSGVVILARLTAIAERAVELWISPLTIRRKTERIQRAHGAENQTLCVAWPVPVAYQPSRELVELGGIRGTRVSRVDTNKEFFKHDDHLSK